MNAELAERVVKVLVELTQKDEIQWRATSSRWEAALPSSECSCTLGIDGSMAIHVKRSTTNEGLGIEATQTKELQNILACKYPFIQMDHDEILTEFMDCIRNQE